MIHQYTKTEEKFNSLTHLIAGFLVSLSSIFFMCTDIFSHGFIFDRICFLFLFGITSVLTFFISYKYHNETDLRKKYFLRKMDHTSIFLTIIGTSVPLAYFSIPINASFYIFVCLEIILAIYGIYFKLMSKKCFCKNAVILYILTIIPLSFIIKNIIVSLSNTNLYLFLASIFACILGIPFYLMKKIKWTHVIWHMFVIASSICSNILLFKLI